MFSPEIVNNSNQWSFPTFGNGGGKPRRLSATNSENYVETLTRYPFCLESPDGKPISQRHD
jgi:hypothetical protein